MKFFAIWVSNPTKFKDFPHKTVTHWLAEVSPQHFGKHGPIAGTLVVPLKTGIDPNSAAGILWLRYFRRCARAWNALRLAAALCGMDEDTPAGVLADKCGDLGLKQLEALIRLSFDLFHDMEIPGKPQEKVPTLPTVDEDAPKGLFGGY